MAELIEFNSTLNRDREALFVWANLPQQRTEYPDFERLLCALPYRTNGHIDDGTHADVTYIHLAVARDGCKGLYIRLNRGEGPRGPNQLTFLSKKESEGYAAGNCFGWEEARDLIVAYMKMVKVPDRTISFPPFEGSI